MRLVVGPAFVVHQPFEWLTGPRGADEDLDFAAVIGFTAGNRGVHDLNRHILLGNAISTGHPVAYDGARLGRRGGQSHFRQPSEEGLRPAGWEDHDRAVHEAAVSRDVRGEVPGRAIGQYFGEQSAGAQRAGELHDPSDAPHIDILER
ncbi:hypothetical protein AB0L00_21555 [Actinoallomurus sp. NPDC052308]|uniref:hypothetical protein n=1 Tax=Actinoallomurus sp. NPDC052308 TaxID=3155530 RepID=UPI003435D9EE